jgi:GNAT superfamily N-acetyltransferase
MIALRLALMQPCSSPVPTITTRLATVADLDVFVADVQAGFDSYVEFAPLGWVPHEVWADREGIGARLADVDTWGLIALAEGAPVGHIAFTPAHRRTAQEPPAARPVIPGLAHLWQLFVLREWWGAGVAPILHDAATEEMRARGYETARLYTPSLHARARRFYERRGWEATGEFWGEQLVLMLTEYRLALG